MNAVLRRAGWALACAILALFLQSFFRQPVAIPLLAAVVALTALAAWRPFHALLVVAGLGPLAAVIFGLGRGAAGSVQFGETIVLAYLAGWTARRAIAGIPLRVSPAVRSLAMLLALAAAASAVVQWFGIRAEAQMEPLREVLNWFVLRDYPLRAPGSEPITSAVVLAAGMLLLLSAADASAGKPERRILILRMMVCGAAGAAAANLLRIAAAAAQQAEPLVALGRLLASTRINTQYADLNAAGSYFALTLLIASGLAARYRTLAVVTVPVIAGGLWLTGSRFALASAFAVAAVLAFAAWRRAASRLSRMAVASALALLVGSAVVVSFRYPEGRNAKAWSAFVFRVDLARAGLQMAAERPLSGVGLGRFYTLSSDYAPQALARLGFLREHAHNQFVQTLAELGIPGLIAFLALIVASLGQSLRREGPPPPHVTGLVAGIGAFLLSCLGGHPLVVPEASYAFWLALGLAAAPATDVPSGDRRWRVIVLAVTIILVSSVPWRAVRAVHEADRAGVSAGLSKWQREADGTRYRWAGNHAAFYFSSSARAITIPLRYGSASTGPIEVRILIDGREADRINLAPEDGWRPVRIVLRRTTASRFCRIDLVSVAAGASGSASAPTDSSGLLRIGRPSDE